WVALAIIHPHEASFADEGLRAATTYYYRLHSMSAALGSVTSNVASATTLSAPPTAPPSAPGGLVSTATSSSQIRLSLTDNASNETGFKVERAPSSSGTWVQIGTTGANVASFADTTIAESTTYYYRVRATSTAGDSGYSNTANATTPGSLIGQT